MPHTYVILYLFVTGIFERSLEKMFSLMEEIKQKQEVMDHKLDTLLQEREDGAGADASGRHKAELPGELDWPLQTPEDVEKLEEILSWDEGKRKAMVSCWKFLKAAVTKYMHVTEMGRGVF